MGFPGLPYGAVEDVSPEAASCAAVGAVPDDGEEPLSRK